MHRTVAVTAAAALLGSLVTLAAAPTRAAQADPAPLTLTAYSAHQLPSPDTTFLSNISTDATGDRTAFTATPSSGGNGTVEVVANTGATLFTSDGSTDAGSISLDRSGQHAAYLTALSTASSSVRLVDLSVSPAAATTLPEPAGTTPLASTLDGTGDALVVLARTGTGATLTRWPVTGTTVGTPTILRNWPAVPALPGMIGGPAADGRDVHDLMLSVSDDASVIAYDLDGQGGMSAANPAVYSDWSTGACRPHVITYNTGTGAVGPDIDAGGSGTGDTSTASALPVVCSTGLNLNQHRPILSSDGGTLALSVEISAVTGQTQSVQQVIDTKNLPSGNVSAATPAVDGPVYIAARSAAVPVSVSTDGSRLLWTDLGAMTNYAPGSEYRTNDPPNYFTRSLAACQPGCASSDTGIARIATTAQGSSIIADPATGDFSAQTAALSADGSTVSFVSRDMAITGPDSSSDAAADTTHLYVEPVISPTVTAAPVTLDSAGNGTIEISAANLTGVAWASAQDHTGFGTSAQLLAVNSDPSGANAGIGTVSLTVQGFQPGQLTVSLTDRSGQVATTDVTATQTGSTSTPTPTPTTPPPPVEPGPVRSLSAAAQPALGVVTLRWLNPTASTGTSVRVLYGRTAVRALSVPAGGTAARVTGLPSGRNYTVSVTSRSGTLSGPTASLTLWGSALSVAAPRTIIARSSTHRAAVRITIAARSTVSTAYWVVRLDFRGDRGRWNYRLVRLGRTGRATLTLTVAATRSVTWRVDFLPRAGRALACSSPQVTSTVVLH